MSTGVYVIKEAYGIYEIMRLDADGSDKIVQTNIRTREKALTACLDWQKLELKRYERQT